MPDTQISAPPRPGVLDLIGDTPVVELTRFDTGPCRLFVKLESQNPGGSIKDRIALSMIEAAERDGRLKPGGTIVEATAGNTGLGLAQVGGAQGLPADPGGARQDGAGEDPAPAGAGRRCAHDPLGRRQGPSRILPGHGRATSPPRLPGAFYVNQFANPANPLAHETTTGAGDLAADGAGTSTPWSCGVGSGGTLTGLGRFFSEVSPKTEMVLADPVGSVLAHYVKTGEMMEAGSWAVEGIGEDFVPPNCRPVAGEAGLLDSATARASRRRATCCARKASSPARPPARCWRRRCATAASRPSRSGWSPSSATAATSTCPRCSTTSGWSSRASPTGRITATLRDLIRARYDRGRHGLGRPGRHACSPPTTACGAATSRSCRCWRTASWSARRRERLCSGVEGMAGRRRFSGTVRDAMTGPAPDAAGALAARRAVADLRARRGRDRRRRTTVPRPDHPRRPDQPPAAPGGNDDIAIPRTGWPSPPAPIHAGQYARPVDRRGDGADLRHLDLRPGKPRRAQGLRVRAQPEPDPLRLRALHRRSGERDGGLRLRLGPGGDRHACWSCSTPAPMSSRRTTSTAARFRLFERVRRRSAGLRLQLRRPAPTWPPWRRRSGRRRG